MNPGGLHPYTGGLGVLTAWEAKRATLVEVHEFGRCLGTRDELGRALIFGPHPIGGM